LCSTRSTARLRLLQGDLHARHLRQSMDASRRKVILLGPAVRDARIYPACCLSPVPKGYSDCCIVGAMRREGSFQCSLPASVGVCRNWRSSVDPFPSLRGRSTIQHAGAGSRATITKPEGENKGAIGQPEVFLDNKAEEKTTKRLARGLGLKTYRMVDTPLRSSHPVAHAQAWRIPAEPEGDRHVRGEQDRRGSARVRGLAPAAGNSEGGAGSTPRSQGCCRRAVDVFRRLSRTDRA
jgi:hypothetical protein